MSLINRLFASIDAQPQALAVVQGNLGYTYAELGKQIGIIASYLRESGLRRGDRVALLMANSFQYVATFYAVWCAGGMTVALNTQSKAREILNWLDHSGSKFLFADATHPELSQVMRADSSGYHIITVRQDKESTGDGSSSSLWDNLTPTRGDLPLERVDDTDLASIIYTSGTTGSPKGVTLSHGNLEANVKSILDYLQLRPSDSIVNVLPFYYSYGNSVLHTHLAAGAKLILENSLLYPHRVIERLANEAATGFSGVPSTFNLILARVNLNDYTLNTVRYLTQAGGAMSPVVAERLHDAMPDAELFIMYGQTEASARLSYLPPIDMERKRGSIGKAIPDVTLEIRDKSGHIARDEEVGEICAKGPNIMQGYWRDPVKTAQVIKNGWLYTGDLARRDQDGYLYIVGRSSEMIKSGGHRISPKEVEEVIQEIDGVEEVAALGTPDETLGEVIKVFVVIGNGTGLDRKMILNHCRQRLPLYKIPKNVEFTHSLPKNAAGKIQKFRLLEDPVPATSGVETTWGQSNE